MGNPAQLKSFLTTTFADAGGPIPFERFMELALYHPDFGYYTANIDDVGGSRADFSTWATIAAPVKAIANWIREEFTHHSCQDIIEIGAGDGSMAQSILKNFSWSERRKLNYRIVEISPALKQHQISKLKRKSVTWYDTVSDALKASGGQAIIFSNELVDAFPAKWLIWDGANWQEIHVKFSTDSGLSEEFRPCDAEVDWQNPPTGQRVELHHSYLTWLDNWLPDFKKGSLLTIDYGAAGYSPNPRGTMRGYFRQKRIEGPGVYSRFGTQDLTCDVNFTDLIIHGEKNNLETVTLENQLSFMSRFHSQPVEHTEAAEAFQVLHQRR